MHRATLAVAATFLAICCLAGCETKEEAARRALLAQPVVNPPRLQMRLVVNAADDVDPFPDPYSPADTMHVDRAILMHEGHVEYARPSTADAGQPVVLVHFTDEGTALLDKITRQHDGQRIALILDGKVLLAPTIRGAIGADAIIDGGEKGFTPAEQRDLLRALHDAILRLPAPSPATAAATQPESAARGN